MSATETNTGAPERASRKVREGVVAGLEPFIDTIVVCTLTALVILSTGVWQRGAEAVLVSEPQAVQTENLLSVLVGSNPRPIVRGQALNEQMFIMLNA